MLRPWFALLPLIAVAASTDAQVSTASTVTIEESSYRISPEVIRLNAGQPVRLDFINPSSVGHDFSAPAFFGRARILSGEVHAGEVDIPRRSQRIVMLIPEKGVYRAHCNHLMHTIMGMKATVVVE